MIKKIKTIYLVLTILFGAFFIAFNALAYQPKLILYKEGDIQIKNPEISRTFYDELKGQPRYYFINSEKDFSFYLNILVPGHSNSNGRYSVNISNNNGETIHYLDGDKFDWQQFYEPQSRDYYVKGPELEEELSSGQYKIEVFSKDNTGKYALVIGRKEQSNIPVILNIYWQLPFLKISFFETSVMQFFITPFGIAGIGFVGFLLIIIVLINYLVALINEVIKHNMAKTLLLTSSGMSMKEEIIKLLQKPAYDITVGFISTAAKPQENLEYLKKDWEIMKEMGFNIEEVDIEGKTEAEVVKLLELKDIIFVEGGNTFYLLQVMRKCNFEKVIKKLLKEGKVYIGASAGSIVAGRTIQAAGWGEGGDKNIAGLKDLRGLSLVPFDIFVHYEPGYSEIIKKKIPDAKKRGKNLKIITDNQALLVQGKEVSLIGKGEAIIL